MVTCLSTWPRRSSSCSRSLTEPGLKHVSGTGRLRGRWDVGEPQVSQNRSRRVFRMDSLKSANVSLTTFSRRTIKRPLDSDSGHYDEPTDEPTRRPRQILRNGNWFPVYQDRFHQFHRRL